MTRVAPVPVDDVDPVAQAAVETQREQLVVAPTSLLTMAHKPRLAAAWANLTPDIMGAGSVDRSLKQLIAYIASIASGCRYCQALTSHSAQKLGMSLEKILAAWEF